ncbi:MAG TPA: RidA family protein [Candidatus Sulfomarinibacteraceae bacterium]|nr:RidA family protein [Candidatus Sulfomarinibacteraceae bacterium]
MPAITSGFQFPWARDLHFSQSVRTDDLVVTSGQAGFDDEGRLVDGGFEAQLRQAFRNLERVLREQGASIDGALRLNAYLSDASQYAAFKTVRAEFLNPPYPASTAVVVGFVFPGMLCEVDAVAARGAVRVREAESAGGSRP